ncbi:fluoride efflux transporter CrcB [Halofilum ochraceum]|uniref:fluoride efflux transporter CrcB n=1 Tax=Halofilum ochraceum TaxID=1611323 RepID=UPI000946B631|nr:fluoride efflux transporter CrcB [Halofilum ochraceum]
MQTWIAIALGGAAGAVSRWLMATGVQRWLGRDFQFPWGTLSVNVLGSFAMGLLVLLFVERFDPGPALRLGLLVGFLGAFTTFSTFAVETVNLVQNDAPLRASVYVLASVGACVTAALAGMLIGRQIIT